MVNTHRLLLSGLVAIALYNSSCALAQSGPPQGKPTWVELMRSGRTALDKGRYDDAESRLLNILTLSKTVDIPAEQVAYVQSLLGEVYLGKRDYPKADEYFGYALHFLGGEESPRTAFTLQKLGTSYIMQRRYPDADPVLRKALALWKRTKGQQFEENYVECLRELSDVLSQEGNFEESERLFQEWSRLTKTTRRSAKKESPPERRFEEAIRMFGRGEDKSGVAILQGLLREGTLPGTLRSRTLDRLAQSYERDKDFAAALPLRNELLKIEEDANGPRSWQYVSALQQVAEDYAKQKKIAEAESLYLRALEIAEATASPDPLRNSKGQLQSIAFGLGDLYVEDKRYSDAEKLFMRVHEKIADPNDPDALLSNLAGVYSKQGRHAEAENIYKNILATEEKQYGPNSGNLTTTLFFLATALSDQKKYAEAEPYFQRTVEIRKSITDQFARTMHSRDSTMLTLDMQNLAECYVAQGQFEKAKPIYEEILEIDHKELGSRSAAVAKDLANLGNLYEKNGLLEQAEQHLKKALQVYDRSTDKTQDDRQYYVRDYARVLRALHRDSEADELEKTSKPDDTAKK